MTRVLHLHSTFAPGGKERRAVQLMNHFATLPTHAGALEHVIVSAEPEVLGAAALIDGRVPVGFPRDFPPLAGRWRVKRLSQLAAAMQGFDLILSYNWGAMDAVMAHALFAPRFGLGPLVHHEDGFNADEVERLKPQRNWYRRLALARARALVVPSARLETIARTQWAQPAGKVVRIANGIDTQAFLKKPRPDALPRLIKRPGELWIGTLAGLRPVKALPRLVRAFAAVPEPWQLVIGGEGPERPAIMAAAREAGVAARVHLPGHIPDPAAAMGLFDLFALSSDSEQFPLSVVEAMAAGRAVVSPAVGDVAGIVAEDNAPWITPPGDEAALGAALAALAGDQTARLRIGGANQARARRLYDFGAMAARYREVYAGALGRAFP